MKYLALTLVLVGCRPSALPALDHSYARAEFGHMGFAVKAAAVACEARARDDQELYELCVRRLIPARDALVFNVDALDPWGPESAAAYGCAGAAVHLALTELSTDFAIRDIPTPAVMVDGERLGAWARQWALPTCDPLHPTTTVTITRTP